MNDRRDRATTTGSSRYVILVFLTSRLLVLSIIFVFSQINVVDRPFGGRAVATRIELNKPIVDVVQKAMVIADGEWFQSIARAGYAPGPFRNSDQKNWAFFPVWPLLMRLVTRSGSLAVCGVLLANLCCLVGLLLFRQLGEAIGLSPESAQRSVLFLALFPSSYFLSVPMSESLFLVLICGAFLAGYRRWWWTAAVIAAVASGTRVTGILLLPALFILHREVERRWFSRRLVPLVLCPAGLVAFMLFLRNLTGNAFAFADLQSQWHRHPSGPLAPLIDAVRGWPVVSVEWDFVLFQFLATLAIFAGVVVLIRMRHYALATFALVSILLALSSGSLQSMSRYALSAAPLFYAAGAAVRHPRAAESWAIASAILLGMFTLLFALRIDIALC